MPAIRRLKDSPKKRAKRLWSEIWSEEKIRARQPSRPIRNLPPGGGLVEVTSRTLHGMLTMKPSPRANQAILGCLGRALAKYPTVKLSAFWFLSNHYNLLAFFPDVAVMRAFMTHLNSNLARELGIVYVWNEKFWGRRYRGILCVDPEAEVRRLAYLLAQGTKEGLVARPRDWPGVSSLFAQLEGKKLIGRWVDRTALYWARKRGEQVSEEDFVLRYPIELAPLPAWSALSEEERRAETADIVSLIERGAQRENRRLNREPLGAKKILGQHPHASPKNFKRSPAPICHASSRANFWKYANAYHAFVERFKELGARVREGDLSALEQFPPGCFRPPAPPQCAASVVARVSAR